MAGATGLEIVDKFFTLPPEKRKAIQKEGAGARFVAIPLKMDTLTRLRGLIEREMARSDYRLPDIEQFFYPSDPRKAQYIICTNLPLGIFIAIQQEFSDSLIIIPGTLDGENPLTVTDLEPGPIN